MGGDGLVVVFMPRELRVRFKNVVRRRMNGSRIWSLDARAGHASASCIREEPTLPWRQRLREVAALATRRPTRWLLERRHTVR